MEKEWYNPVEQLKPDMQELLNHITFGLSKEIQNAILKANIRIDYDTKPAQLYSPISDPIVKLIVIQDVYLAFLWCCSYATVAFNKMYYEKAELDLYIVTFNDRPELPIVDLTLHWARSLIERVTVWPDEAARPDKPDRWTEEANNLFLACVAYILFHEIGHLLLHSGLVDELVKKKLKRNSKISKKDISRLRNAENEADEFALISLIADSTIDDVVLSKYLGASLAHLSNFYLCRKADTRGGVAHPDLDDRLRVVINKAKLAREADQIQFQAHLSVGLQLFLHLTGKQFIPDDQIKFDRFDDLEAHLFLLIAEFKRSV